MSFATIIRSFFWLVEGHRQQVFVDDTDNILLKSAWRGCYSVLNFLRQMVESWQHRSFGFFFFNLSYISIHCFFLSLSKTLLGAKYIIEMWSFLPFLHNTRDFKSGTICHVYSSSISCWLSSSLSGYNLRLKILHSPPYNLYLTFKGKKCH